jgi:hypothetical protein
MSDPTPGWPPLRIARMAAAFYILTIIAGSLSLILKQDVVALNVVADLCYMAVTLLFYFLFKPVSQRLSMVAAAISLAGCIIGLLAMTKILPVYINPLAFFGIYCLLIGYLVIISTFLPRILGLLMIAGGLGWLTFISPALVHRLFPYNLAPGIVAETTLTLWLLIKGVDVARWTSVSGHSAPQR